MVNRLILTSEQITKVQEKNIGIKLSLSKDRYLYSSSPKEILLNVINSYNYLRSLTNVVEKEVKEEIEKYLLQFKEIYESSKDFYFEIDGTSLAFSKGVFMKKIRTFLKKNDESINVLLSDIYSMEKFTESYDLEKHLGLRGLSNEVTEANEVMEETASD